MAYGKSLDSVRDALLRSDPDFRRAWEDDRPKRSVALALVRLRLAAGLTQAALARATGWDKAFVSRMETASGGMPDTVSIARYCEACGASAGLIMVRLDEAGEPNVLLVPLGADAGIRAVGAAMQTTRPTQATMVAEEPFRESVSEAVAS